MGFTGLARWVNADAESFRKVEENIRVNHGGIYRTTWNMAIRSYRSTFGMTHPGSLPGSGERTMCTVTMNDNVFVLLEDPGAPTRTDSLLAPNPEPVTHYRTTFLTARPPGNLEQLLAQLKARWTSVRGASSTTTPRSHLGAQQLAVEGKIFSIGSDWLVRVGLVTLGANITPKGMLLEAEYLPLPVLHSPIPDGTAELVSNLLTSILPNVAGANTVAVTISDAQWQDVLWDREEEAKKANEPPPKNDPDDVYVYGDEDIFVSTKHDWVGVDRDRRSAFLVMGALRSENIL